MKKNKNVVIDGRAFDNPSSSVSIYLYNLTKKIFKNKNYNFFVIVNNKKHPLKNQGGNVQIIYSSIKNNILWDNFVVPFWATKKDADIIFYPKSSSCWYKIPGKTIISTIHGMIYKKEPQNNRFSSNVYWRTVGKIASLVSSKIIAVSKHDKKDLFSEGYNRKKIEVIPIGVNDAFFKKYPEEKKEKVLTKYAIDRKKYLVQLGHITNKKNQKFSFKLFKRIEKKYPELKLVFIGSKKRNGEYFSSLKKKIDNSGLNKRVIFTGAIDQNKDQAILPILLSESSLALFPSTYEGFGMPAVEAMATETVGLCSNRGSLPEVVGEDNVIPLENKKLWENQMIKFIENKKFYKRKNEQQKNITKKYHWENISNKYIELFNKLTTS